MANSKYNSCNRALKSKERYKESGEVMFQKRRESNHNYEFKYGKGFLFVYLSISLGTGLQVSGSNWDIIWHGLNHVETFFTPPHSVIYSGVILTSGPIIYGIALVLYNKRYRHYHIGTGQNNNNSGSKISGLSLSSFSSAIAVLPLYLALIGVMLQLSAGPFDFWWHNNFGFDGLLSPPHSILTSGMLLALLGALVGVFQIDKHENKKRNKINNNG